MKFDTHDAYDPDLADLAERALLTVWPGLSAWHEDLVLVGGLAPKYLCRPPPTAQALPRPVTADVDLGIALAADGDQYGSLRAELGGQGFQPNQMHPWCFEKIIEGLRVPLDFLVEKPPLSRGNAQVADITAGVMPGIARALASARTQSINGIDLHGARQSLAVRVCEAGPFLALKLRAFRHRQQPKDAFDILYTLLHYDGGTSAAIAAFAEEVRLGNPACPDALHTLRVDFASETAPGPVKASHFIHGAAPSSESQEATFLRLALRQQMVDAAAQLLKAAGS